MHNHTRCCGNMQFSFRGYCNILTQNDLQFLFASLRLLQQFNRVHNNCFYKNYVSAFINIQLGPKVDCFRWTTVSLVCANCMIPLNCNRVNFAYRR